MLETKIFGSDRLIRVAPSAVGELFELLFAFSDLAAAEFLVT